MQIDRYGLSRDYVTSRGFRILFGVDWFSEAEFDAIASEMGDAPATLSIMSDGRVLETRGPASFSEAVAMESEEVANDTIISFSDDLHIYVSDDRDVFYIAGSPERLTRILRSIAGRGMPTFTSSVVAGLRTPPRLVKDFYERWKDVNLELERPMA